MGGYYVLNEDNSVRPIEDAVEWAEAFEDRERRRVGRDELEDGTLISTVFLGLDHSFGIGKPMIFETMVFPPNSSEDGEPMWRYSTWAEATVGHAKVVELVKSFRAAGRPLTELPDELA